MKWNFKKLLVNGKMTASCQMNVSQVVFQTYTNNKNNLCKTVKCFNLLQVCPCVPPFVFAVLFISSIHVLNCYFYVALSLVAQQFQ